MSPHLKETLKIKIAKFLKYCLYVVIFASFKSMHNCFRNIRVDGFVVVYRNVFYFSIQQAAFARSLNETPKLFIRELEGDLVEWEENTVVLISAHCNIFMHHLASVDEQMSLCGFT